VTTDGKQVIGGVFPLVSSEGIPLEVLVQQIHHNGRVIDWYGFWNDSLKAGWNPHSTRTKILTSIGETLGPKIREEHRKILDFLYEVEMATRNEDEERVKELLLEHRELERKTQRKRLLNKLKTRA
jgi:hypothetical protein